MYIYMGHVNYEHTKPYEDWFWQKNRIDLKRGWVSNVNFDKKELVFTDNSRMNYDKLILATGSRPNFFDWKGQGLRRVQGLYSYQDLEQLQSYSDEISTAVIVGGGLIGIELAEMLNSKGKKVHFLVRESSFWNQVLPPDESELINRHIREHHIDLRLSTELEEILDDGHGNVKGILTKSGETIECEFVGITVGVQPNIKLFKNSPLETERGILVNEYLETNLPDVYAAGDCVQHLNPPPGRRALEQIWYTGRIMGETLAHNLTGDKRPYLPGVFFNSAKFLDIEYQTYGEVPATLPENSLSFCWQHSAHNKLVRINFDQETRAVLGVNTFGIRMRQEVWQTWIANKTSVDEVICSLKSANFEPEFFQRFEGEIIREFNRQFKTSHQPISSTKRLLALFNR